MEELQRQDRGHVRILNLNRPSVSNALSHSLILQLVRAFGEADAEADVRAIVLTSSGDKAFCAGLDLKELSDGTIVAGDLHEERLNLDLAMRRCTKPIVGAIQGAAVAGGFELALGCDIRMAGAAARFCDAHLRVGLLPGWGLSQKLPRLIGPARAKELSLTMRSIGADLAYDWGLVNGIADGDVRDEAVAIAQRISEHDPATVQAYSGLIDRGWELPLEQAMALEERTARRWNGSMPPDLIRRRLDPATPKLR